MILEYPKRKPNRLTGFDYSSSGTYFITVCTQNRECIYAVGWLKYQITRQINATDEIFGRRIFQRSYYDHIIRNKNDFRMIWKYIDENPITWENDCFYV